MLPITRWFRLQSGGQADVKGGRWSEAVAESVKIEEEKEAARQARLSAARRVVVKLGTNIVNGKGGEISVERVRPIVASIALLKKAGRQFVLVSSGAVGLGAGRLGLHRERLADLVTRQA